MKQERALGLSLHCRTGSSEMHLGLVQLCNANSDGRPMNGKRRTR